MAPTPAPVTPAPVARGIVNDPLIVGLAGQRFKFDGHSGSWYSAISAPAFQWNMRISEYDSCPAESNAFVTAAAFSFFDDAGKARTVEVNVVNEYNTNVGCGHGADKKNCLGDGSIEIVIDGKKTSFGGDYKFLDGSGRILAFNTFSECSRKWYDFDLDATNKGRSLRSMGVFDVIGGLKKTMINEDVCGQWLAKRVKNGDLFEQSGHYSTIIIQTEDVSFHVEYKQEHERCNAHSLDVWMSSVTPRLMDQEWQGVIGETKNAPTTKKDLYSREEMLKFPDDESYEVNSPYTTKCKACANSS